MNNPELRTTIVFIIVVIAFNIHPLLIIPAIILGYLYIMHTALSNNTDMFSNLFQPDNKDIEYTKSTKSTIPSTNPLPGTMYISAQQKAEYLQSHEWLALKEARLVIANYQCESCGNTNNLELHHINYQRLTQEHLGDVRIQCNTCHSVLHDKLGYDRQTIYPIN